MNKNDLVTSDGRKLCWNARDLFWSCLDAHQDDRQKCLNERELYEKECSKTWVKHFDRRRDYLKFKNVIDSGDKEKIDELLKKSKSTPK